MTDLSRLQLLVIGILFEVLLAAAFTRVGIVNAVLKGIMCGMASVFVANIVKQIRVK